MNGDQLHAALAGLGSGGLDWAHAFLDEVEERDPLDEAACPAQAKVVFRSGQHELDDERGLLVVAKEWRYYVPYSRVSHVELRDRP